ncbi:MAG: prepilin peptidase [Candidatus Altiarchaeota archaeon]|nr:prepilin peptidase [Candidatus Altiarchaeota archaeon]
MFFSVVLVGCIVALVLASLEDLKTGEISDWKSVGLAGYVLFFALLNSAYVGDYSIISTSILWGLAYLILSILLFYLGQWGGGDVKVMAALGACMGYFESTGFQWPETRFLAYGIHPLLSLIINMGFISVPYAMLYTLLLGFKKPKVFHSYFLKIAQPGTILVLTLTLLPSFVSVYAGFLSISALYLMLPLFYMASVYMKTVENVVLTKKIKVAKLKPWDILSKDLHVGGKLIATRRNIEGVTPQQVALINKLAREGKIPKTIDIRWGIKFLPVIALSFLAALFMGDALSIFFKLFASVP